MDFLRPHNTKFHTGWIILLGFLGIIVLGGLLLMLPISSVRREWTDPLSAFFTSTSATCVTGLVVHDTQTYWSGFGTGVILALIQIGGLSFMSVATLFSLVMRRSISYKERIVMAQTLSLDSNAGVVRITRHILIGTFAIESVGALILTIAFTPYYGFPHSVVKGVFHSVSAFCNAGFDLLGDRGQYSSLMTFSDNAVIHITLALLIILGGLGFVIWEDIYTKRSFRKLTFYSKLVIITSLILIITGTLFLFAIEHANPHTMGPMNQGGKWLAAFFQSVSARTAGFNSVDLDGLRTASKLLLIILMFIGAASGSTGGGIKVSTFSVLMLAAFSAIRGRRQVWIAERKIAITSVIKAAAIATISLLMMVVCTMVLVVQSPHLPFVNLLFESVSALGTVGLSCGVTAQLPAVSKIALMLLMFFGRVGLLVVGIRLIIGSNGNKAVIDYPETRVFIG